MKVSDLHPSNYLKAADIDEDVSVVIASVKLESMKDKDGNEEDKAVLKFKNLEKGLVLNVTNKNRILAQYPAEDTDEWIGKRITLTKEWVEAFGKADWAIRVKMMPPATAKRLPRPEQDVAKGMADAMGSVIDPGPDHAESFS